jgi:hypothetical protein
LGGARVPFSKGTLHGKGLSVHIPTGNIFTQETYMENVFNVGKMPETLVKAVTHASSADAVLANP